MELKSYLRRAPLQTHHEQRNASRAEESTNVVDLTKHMTSGVLFSKARRVLVTEDAKQETNKIPYSN